jgi:broad specificity phosphatase PhoE
MANSGELWLIRHGETEWSRSGQHTSRTDIPLTPDGERHARELAILLANKDFALVLTSPMQRARVTCNLAGYGSQAQVELDLIEWDYGRYEGLTTDQIRSENPDWTIWTGTPPGGESAGDVGARADRVIAKIVASIAETTPANQAAKAVALFGHGHMLRVLAARWLGLEALAGQYFSLSTGSVSVLGYEHGTRVMNLWNRTP